MELQGDYLRSLRHDTGLTQVDVAKALELRNVNMVGHWESGRCWVDPKHHPHLADLYGVVSKVFSGRLRLFRDPTIAESVTLDERTVTQLISQIKRREDEARAAAKRSG